jgi:uncharacterized protein YegL
VRKLRISLDLPAGTHEARVGIKVEPTGKLHYRLGFPSLPQVELVTGPVSGLTDEATDAAPNPLDVILALDVSGSMAKAGKIEAAKRAVRKVLHQVDGHDIRVALVSFGEQVALESPLDTPVKKVAKLVASFQAGGGTPMAAALDLADKHFTEQSAGRDQILVLTTDGHPDDMHRAYRAAQRVKEHCTLVTLGIGHDVDKEFLLEIASTPAHYRSAKNADAIPLAFQEIVDLYILPEGGR